MKGLIFTYLLTYGGALVSLVDPFPGLLIYICFAIIRPDAMWFWSVPQGNYSRTVAIALLIGWLIRGFGSWTFGRGGLVVGMLVGFFTWAGLSSVFAADQSVALNYMEDVGKIVLPFLVGITTLNSPGRLKQLAWVIALSHGYVALEMNQSYFGGYNRVWEEGFGAMDNNCVAIAMVTATGLTLFLGLSVGRWWAVAIAMASALLMIHTVLFSFSRGGMLALVLMGLVSFLLMPKRPIHFVLFAVVALIGFRLAGAEVMKRFESSFAGETQRDSSAESRLRLWANCCDLIAKKPVLGIGPHHFPLVAASYGWPAGKEAHSLWFQTAAELGIPGVLFLGLFYLTCIVRLWPVARGRTPVPDPALRDLARAVIAALFGFVISAQFVSLIGLEAPYYIVLLGAGILRLAGAPAGAHRPTEAAFRAMAGPATAVPAAR
jgi:putative inorganic carbon (HCO3(-)) transporter